MSTNDPPQGPYGPPAWPPQNPSNDPTAPYPYGGSGGPGQGGSWPPQQPPPQQQPGGWSEQPTTQWAPQQPAGWPDQGPGTQPQAPYGAPPGPPGGPPYYPQPGGGGSSGGSKAALWIIGGVVALVLVLVVAVVGVLAARGPDPTPTTIGGRNAKADTKVLWTLPEPPGSDLKGANKLAALWLSDDSLIRGTVVGLTAYDIETGKQQWSRPMPSGTSMCQVTPEVVNGVGAVIFGETLSTGAKCDRLMAVDAKTGDERWNISLKQPGDRVRNFSDSFTSVSIASDVVVAQNSDAVRGYTISSGSRKWGVVPTGGSASSCRPINSLASGDRAVVVLDCLSRGSVSLVNAVTGIITWSHTTTSSEGDPLFMDPISVKPVVLVSRSLGGRSQAIVLDDDNEGALKHQISSTVGGSSALDFGSDGSRLDGQVFNRPVVRDGKLFAATEGASGARRNEIVAVDLSTGQVSWTTPSAPDTRETLVKVDDEGVLTLNQGTFEKLPRLVRYDANTGKGKNGATIPDSVRSKLFGVRTFVEGNKIVLATLRSSPDRPPVTVLGE